MSDYHGRMINIPAPSGEAFDYKVGHRDARHAAATIAAEADAEIARLREALERLVEQAEIVDQQLGDDGVTEAAQCQFAVVVEGARAALTETPTPAAQPAAITSNGDEG